MWKIAAFVGGVAVGIATANLLTKEPKKKEEQQKETDKFGDASCLLAFLFLPLLFLSSEKKEEHANG